MKETELPQKDQVEIVKQVQQKKQVKFMGAMQRGDGHHLFEFDRKTLELRKVHPEKKKTAMFKEKTTLKPGQVYVPHDLNRPTFKMRENCFYLYALNSRNASRKIFRKLKVPNVIEILDEQ